MMPEQSDKPRDWLDSLAELDPKALVRPFAAVRSWLQKNRDTESAEGVIDARKLQRALDDIPVQKRKAIIELLEAGNTDAQALAVLMRESQRGQVRKETLLKLPQVAKTERPTQDAPVSPTESVAESGIPAEFAEEARATAEYYIRSAATLLEEHLQTPGVGEEYVSGIRNFLAVIQSLPIEIEYRDEQGNVHLSPPSATGNQSIRVTNAKPDSDLMFSRANEGGTGKNILFLPVKRLDTVWAGMTVIGNVDPFNQAPTPNNRTTLQMLLTDQALLVSRNIALEHQSLFSLKYVDKTLTDVQNVYASLRDEHFVTQLCKSPLSTPPPQNRAEALLKLKVQVLNMLLANQQQSATNTEREMALRNAVAEMPRIFPLLPKIAERWVEECRKTPPQERPVTKNTDQKPEASMPPEFVEEAKESANHYLKSAKEYAKSMQEMHATTDETMSKRFAKITDQLENVAVDISYRSPTGAITNVRSDLQTPNRIQMTNRQEFVFAFASDTDGICATRLPLTPIEPFWAAVAVISNLMSDEALAQILKHATPNRRYNLGKGHADAMHMFNAYYKKSWNAHLQKGNPTFTQGQKMFGGLETGSLLLTLFSHQLGDAPPTSEEEAFLRLQSLNLSMSMGKTFPNTPQGFSECTNDLRDIRNLAHTWYMLYQRSSGQRTPTPNIAATPESPESDWPKEYLTAEETFAFTTEKWPQIAKVLETYEVPKNPKDFNARWEPTSILFELKNAITDAGLWHAADVNKAVQMDTYLNGIPAYVMILHPQTPPPRVRDGNRVCTTVLEPANGRQRENVHVNMDAIQRQTEKPVTQTWQMLSYIGAMVDLKQTCEEPEARTAHLPINDKETHRKAEWWMLRKTFAQMLAADQLTNGTYAKHALEVEVKNAQGDYEPVAMSDARFPQILGDMMANKSEMLWGYIRTFHKDLDIDHSTDDAELHERIMFEVRSLCALPWYTLDADAMDAGKGVDATIALHRELATKYNMTLVQAVDKVVAAAKKEIAARKAKNQEPSSKPKAPISHAPNTPNPPNKTPDVPANTVTTSPAQPLAKTDLECTLEANGKLGAPTLTRELLHGAMIFVKRLTTNAPVDANALWQEVMTHTSKETRTELGAFALRCTELSRELERVVTTMPPDADWPKHIRTTVEKIVRGFLEDKLLKKCKPAKTERMHAIAMLLVSTIKLGKLVQQRCAPAALAPNDAGSNAITHALLRDWSRQENELSQVILAMLDRIQAVYGSGNAFPKVTWDGKRFDSERLRDIQALYGECVAVDCMFLEPNPLQEANRLHEMRIFAEAAIGNETTNQSAKLYRERLHSPLRYTLQTGENSLCLYRRFETIGEHHMPSPHCVGMQYNDVHWRMDALAEPHVLSPTVPLPLRPRAQEIADRAFVANAVPVLHQRMMNIIRLQCPMLLTQDAAFFEGVDFVEMDGAIIVMFKQEQATHMARILGVPPEQGEALEHSRMAFKLPNPQETMRALGWEVRNSLPQKTVPKADGNEKPAADAANEHKETVPAVPVLEPAISDRLHLFLGMLLKHGQQVWAHPENAVVRNENEVFPEISVLEGSKILIVCPAIGTSFILTGGGGHLYTIPGVMTPEQAMNLSAAELRKYYTTLTKEDSQAVTSIDTVLNTCKEQNPGLLPLGRDYFVEELRAGTDKALDALIIDLENVAKTSGKNVEQLNTTDFSNISSGDMHFKLGGVCHGSTFLHRAYRALSHGNEHASELVPEKKLSSTVAVLKTMALQRKRMQDVLRGT